ncbi:hypothetical protein PO124_01815 [Bacillus licheniformis]|nr:hypothetical protein [Bacillus licheniformis]
MAKQIELLNEQFKQAQYLYPTAIVIFPESLRFESSARKAGASAHHTNTVSETVQGYETSAKHYLDLFVDDSSVAGSR